MLRHSRSSRVTQIMKANVLQRSIDPSGLPASLHIIRNAKHKRIVRLQTALTTSLKRANTPLLFKIQQSLGYSRGQRNLSTVNSFALIAGHISNDPFVKTYVTPSQSEQLT